MYLEKLKEMFEEMVVKKNVSLIPFYYHKDFVLYANDQTMIYETYLKFHQEIYETPITYEVAYDEETFLEQDEKIAGRVWIKTRLPHESSKTIEVILIARFKDGKIYRLWELTYPDWSKLPEFQ
ncbi:MAG: nuclear transport factor 2 family protein [Alphaproteobacteria bacterium]|nr:nuclear transport factor 2 family protein [Alphaproteobacteria bacterium]